MADVPSHHLGVLRIVLADLIIVIPGIMGSVLSRPDAPDPGDRVPWDPGPSVAMKLLRHRRWVESLKLNDVDDPANPGWLDGIVPTGLVSSRTMIPGLVRIDGYSELDEKLRQAFGKHLIEGDPLHPENRADGKDPRTAGVPNYYRFAYDWRRDLRASALRLNLLIEDALPRLRQQRSPNAKVLFITHSMGGLVARYYIEGIDPRTGDDFDGWRNTRELLSFGTPYRGSLDAATHLVNGFKKLFVDFSDSLRSYTGVYQLLPRYRAIEDGGQWRYPHELDVDGLDAARAKAAYQDFHCVIEDGVARHRQDPTYNRSHVVPLIGYGHSTLNSAIVVRSGGAGASASGLRVEPSLPAGVPPNLAGGDGTVPLVSALPLDYADEGHGLATVRFANQEHGSIQIDRRVLADEIEQRLRAAQRGTAAVRGPRIDTGDPTGQPHLQTRLPGTWIRGEVTDLHGGRAGVATVETRNVDEDGPISVTVSDLDGNRPVLSIAVDSGQEFELPDEPGAYAVAVTAAGGLETSGGYTVIDPEEPG